MEYKVINRLQDGRTFSPEAWREGLKNGTIVVPEHTKQIMFNFMIGTAQSKSASLEQ